MFQTVFLVELFVRQAPQYFRIFSTVNSTEGVQNDSSLYHAVGSYNVKQNFKNM